MLSILHTNTHTQNVQSHGEILSVISALLAPSSLQRSVPTVKLKSLWHQPPVCHAPTLVMAEVGRYLGSQGDGQAGKTGCSGQEPK